MRARIALILSALAFAVAAHAQSTAFTYQGRLNNGAQAAAGLHDFRFRLWDGVAGGAQLGSTLCVDNILVSDGVFTATIDFGQQFVTPSARFLEIEVRADTGLNCGNVGGFVVLSPRQVVASAPIATHARTAFSLASADGSEPNAVVVDNDGKVGIGTQAPTHWVTVSAPVPTLALQDTSANADQSGYVSWRNADNIETAWVGYGSAGSPNFGVVNARTGGHIFLLPFSGNVGVKTQSPANSLSVSGSADFTGNVGIGTAAPAAKLDVRGDIRLGPTGQFRAASGDENLRIIRGTVDIVGACLSTTILAGSGFSAQLEGGCGVRITFTTPFSGTPTVIGTGIPGVPECMPLVAVLQVSTSSVLLDERCADTDGNSNAAWPFGFIAIGPR